MDEKHTLFRNFGNLNKKILPRRIENFLLGNYKKHNLFRKSMKKHVL